MDRHSLCAKQISSITRRQAARVRETDSEREKVQNRGYRGKINVVRGEHKTEAERGRDL